MTNHCFPLSLLSSSSSPSSLVFNNQCHLHLLLFTFSPLKAYWGMLYPDGATTIRAAERRPGSKLQGLKLQEPSQLPMLQSLRGPHKVKPTVVFQCQFPDLQLSLLTSHACFACMWPRFSLAPEKLYQHVCFDVVCVMVHYSSDR